jgi:HEAT repeat protein
MSGRCELPPEDRPDTIDVAGVRGIPIIHEDDPRFEEERAAWSRARARAQAMHSANELLNGLRDDDWMVRHEVVDRLVARARNDERTIPALIRAAADPVWEVRGAVVMSLIDLPGGDALNAIRVALTDDHHEVRSSAAYALRQRGEETP